MRTLTEIKNQVAQRHGYEDWRSVLSEFLNYREYSDIILLENEAIIEWGNQCKEAQRESDAQAVDKDVPHGAILNNPLVTDKID